MWKVRVKYAKRKDGQWGARWVTWAAFRMEMDAYTYMGNLPKEWVVKVERGAQRRR